MYAYVGGDPVNRRDPSGLSPKRCRFENPGPQTIDVCGDDDSDNPRTDPTIGTGSGFAGFYGPGMVGSDALPYDGPGTDFANGDVNCAPNGGACTYAPAIVVTAPRPPFWVRYRWQPQATVTGPAFPDWCGSRGTEFFPEGNWAQACRRHDACYSRLGAIKEVCDLELMAGITVECSERIFIPGLCAVPGAAYGVGLIVGGVPGLPARNAFDEAQRQSRR